MSNLKSRLTALESAVPSKPWFTIEVVHQPDPEQWAEINEAHAEGREVFIFKQDASLGVWLPGMGAVYWSADNE